MLFDVFMFKMGFFGTAPGLLKKKDILKESLWRHKKTGRRLFAPPPPPILNMVKAGEIGIDKVLIRFSPRFHFYTPGL